MKHFLALIAVSTFPALTCAEDAPFEMRKVVKQDSVGAVQAEHQKETLYLEGTPALAIEHLAQATCKKEASGPCLELDLTTAGARLFSELTAKSQGEKVAVLVNGKVLMVPVIREQITSGTLVISGSFSNQELQAMAKALNQSVFENSKETLTFTGESVVYRTPILEYVFPILEGSEMGKLAPGLKITGYKERMVFVDGKEIDQSSIFVNGNGEQQELKMNEPVKVFRREVVGPDGDSEVWWRFE